jgi:hypothetical protein
VEVKFVSDLECAKLLEACRPEEEVRAEANAPVLAALAAIDLKSIRSLRECLAAQPDAPQWIKDYEDAAIAQRSKLLK